MYSAPNPNVPPQMSMYQQIPGAQVQPNAYYPQMHPQMMQQQIPGQQYMHPQMMQPQMMQQQMMQQQIPGQAIGGYPQYQQMVASHGGLSEMEKSQILNFFSQAAGIDKLLDQNEFALVLKHLQPQFAQSPQFPLIVQRYFQEIDVDRNGYIDANEFLNAYVRLKSSGF